jgi:hypothetical protein
MSCTRSVYVPIPLIKWPSEGHRARWIGTRHPDRQDHEVRQEHP